MDLELPNDSIDANLTGHYLGSGSNLRMKDGAVGRTCIVVFEPPEEPKRGTASLYWSAKDKTWTLSGSLKGAKVLRVEEVIEVAVRIHPTLGDKARQLT